MRNGSLRDYAAEISPWEDVRPLGNIVNRRKVIIVNRRKAQWILIGQLLWPRHCTKPFACIPSLIPITTQYCTSLEWYSSITDEGRESLGKLRILTKFTQLVCGSVKIGPWVLLTSKLASLNNSAVVQQPFLGSLLRIFMYIRICASFTQQRFMSTCSGPSSILNIREIFVDKNQQSPSPSGALSVVEELGINQMVVHRDAKSEQWYKLYRILKQIIGAFFSLRVPYKRDQWIDNRRISRK